MSFNEIDDMYSKIVAPILNTKPKLQSYNIREKKRYNFLTKKHIEENEIKLFKKFLKKTNICIVYNNIDDILYKFECFKNSHNKIKQILKKEDINNSREITLLGKKPKRVKSQFKKRDIKKYINNSGENFKTLPLMMQGSRFIEYKFGDNK